MEGGKCQEESSKPPDFPRAHSRISTLHTGNERNIMYTNKLAYIRYLHRPSLSPRKELLCRIELSQGVKLPSLYPYLLISHGLALGLVHYREKGVFFYTHYSLCKSFEALFFHFRKKLCQKLKVMRLRMDRQGFNTFYYTIESFQKFRATAL